eukprot:TRINITY_DN6835_c0_g2_i1.p1 TRINITY_DN6835_c0_g2~~TRINITY_DN6835_c0_g2_i1.p1  ORF type:complete len:707 (+),score=174.47 TRINITY_DN6835_c0_g2_i1:128-2248(+)
MRRNEASKLWILCSLAAFFSLALLAAEAKRVPSGNEDDFAPPISPRQRALNLLQQFSLENKIAIVHGYDGAYAGTVWNITELGFPTLRLQDGPQGVGDGATDVTAWPSALTVVASWDVDMMYDFAAAMAVEQQGKGTNIMLGPMINIARVPMGGRNFESFGEDPTLAAKMVASSVQGIQDQGVIATAKHYVDNNQEYNRTLVSENVPQRAQWEIYYPAFKAAVDAGVGAIMCSYNLINNTYACENNQTLNTDLKGRMGFQGFIMSDWGATHSTVPSALAGLDMEMPDNYYFGQSLLDAVTNGTVPQERVDDMVVRILTSMFAVGLFDIPQPTGNLGVNVMSPEHNELARQLAEASTVLLKNDNMLLPLDPLGNAAKTIAIIGGDAGANATAVGWGSGHVILPYLVTPYDGINNLVGDAITLTYTGDNIDEATQAAANADVAIVFVATDSSEGIDRTTLSLEPQLNDLVSAVAGAQPNTVVVVNTPGAVLMPWIDQVQAILCPFLPGQEDGNAIANILFGYVTPSGKLPVTFPISDSQIDCNTTQQYPGIDNEADYTEGIFVGYRWYDHYNFDPLFPFGHGLSYTTFDYSDFQMEIRNDYEAQTANFTLTVTNNGTQFSGAEVVQFYLGFPAEAGEPPKVLRGFQKTRVLTPGESQVVGLGLSGIDMSIWNVTYQDWEEISGVFTIYIGSSSRDIRVSSNFVWLPDY